MSEGEGSGVLSTVRSGTDQIFIGNDVEGGGKSHWDPPAAANQRLKGRGFTAKSCVLATRVNLFVLVNVDTRLDVS